MPRALDMLIEMASSDDVEEAEYIAPSLLEVIKNDPKITDKEKQKIDSKSSRWIASNALRELTSEKVQTRLKKKQ